MSPSQFDSFKTMNGFYEAVQKCRVYLQNQTNLELVQGLQRAVKMVEEIDQARRKVVIIGNGGSAAIASHQAVDLWKNAGIRATAFNDISLITCISNDFSYPEVFSKPVEMFCDPGDLLIAISSSGKSPNILGGVEMARKSGCGVICFSGFLQQNPLNRLGDINFYIPSDSYGIVEVAHLLLIHAIVDEVIELKKRGTQTSELRNPKRALY